MYEQVQCMYIVLARHAKACKYADIDTPNQQIVISQAAPRFQSPRRSMNVPRSHASKLLSLEAESELSPRWIQPASGCLQLCLLASDWKLTMTLTVA